MVALTLFSGVQHPYDARETRARRAHLWLGLLFALTCLMSLASGASDISLWTVLGKLLRAQELTSMEHVVLFDTRLPGMVLDICVGAGLAISGTVMQGLFRNPLADPGIVGVGAGAGFGAICAIVLREFLPVALQAVLGSYLVSGAVLLGDGGRQSCCTGSQPAMGAPRLRPCCWRVLRCGRLRGLCRDYWSIWPMIANCEI